MNILLIGNGFDLAHNLPTRYDDFLDFIKALSLFLDNKESDCNQYNNSPELNKLNSNIKFRLIYNFSDDFFKEFWKNTIANNIWLNYFLDNRTLMKKNWVDFEREIYYVISNLDNHIKSNKQFSENDFFITHFNVNDDETRFFLSLKLSFLKKDNISKFEINLFIDELEKDLEKLIFALEIYIGEYVNKINVNRISREINNLNINKVLSFNYSNTFKRLYPSRNKKTLIDYDFIHGKAISHHYYKNNNLVLGINEYLPDNEKNVNLRFIRYKKYFQRIHKKTGCKYSKWIDMINQSSSYDNELYILGHSLDNTDGDVLKELLLNDKITTTIYYHNEDAYEQQIINLVKLIGQDELVKRTGGLRKRILFKEQPEFEKINPFRED